MEAELYDELWRVEQRHWWFVARRRIVGSLVKRFSPSEAGRLQICELGCGTGGNLAEFRDAHDICGMDVSEKALRYARRRVGARVEPGSLPGDVPFPVSSFDVVLMTDVLEHIEDDAASARVAMSLLKDRGILVATVPAHQWLYSPRDAHHQHFRRYGRRDFEQLFRMSGVKVELLSYYNSLLFAPAAAVRLASKLLPGRAPGGDLHVPAAPLNRTLGAIFGWERTLLGRLPVPTGLSLIVVARRVGSSG